VVVLASAIALSMGAGAASPAPAASASSAADAVRQRLQLSPVLAGEFEQRKVLEGFRNPLVSHGEFLVARGQGVWWHTTKPFESTLVVTRSRLVTHAPDGTSNDGVDATSEPGLRQVNEMIFSLLGGDVDALAQRFDVAAQTTSSGWQLTLTPKDANVAKFLRRATLAGDRFVDSVYLDEARGDSTQIRFSHQSPAAALTADERARFK
jgi:outer membrane lipoprotein-sorting protein